jgi:hypothetical protein
MKQNIPQNETGLLSRSATAINGANQHTVTIPLVYNNGAALAARRTAAINSRDARDAGLQEFRTAQTQHEQKAAEVRTFSMLTRDLLRPSYGYKYSQAWAGTGFTNKLVIPSSLTKLETLVESLAGFLTDNPGKESSSSGVTAVIAEGLHTDLSTLRHAVQGKETALRTRTQEKRAKFADLRQTLTAQARELKELIPADDLRWKDYGLNIPAIKERPATPTNITVVLIGPNALSVKWDRSARAEYYRVWMRIIGVGTEFAVAGTPADLDMILESLPSNATVELALSALNNGGESARSEVIAVQTL